MRCGKYREGVILNESRMKMAVFMEDRKTRRRMGQRLALHGRR